MSDEGTTKSPEVVTPAMAESSGGGAPPVGVPGSPVGTEPPPEPIRVKHGLSAVWWGVALVVVGGALLVSQFVPNIQIWRWWPLVIVAFGIRAMFGPSGAKWSVRHFTEGLSTVAIGLVFLGQMIGYLDWNVWLSVLRLWPLLIVSLGVELLGKGLRSEWVRALSGLVVVAGLAYAALVMTPASGWPIPYVAGGQSEPFAFEEAHDGDIEVGSARIDGGIGELTVRAGDSLATAEGHSPFDPIFELSSGGRTAEARIGLGEGAWGPAEGQVELHVTLDSDVVWELDVDAGVTEYEVDLSGVALSGLRVDSGVSNGTLILGRADASGSDERVSVRIDAGVSSLTIRVPEGDSVRLKVESGLTGTDTRGEWDTRREGDDRIYESAGFSAGGAYWDIDVNAGIGQIVIEYY